jgi:hypothetical protein
MALPLSYPEKKKAVIGYLSTNGFAGVPEPFGAGPDAFTNTLCSVVFEAAIYLRREGKTSNTLTLIEAIDQDRMHSRIAKDAAVAEGLPDWQTLLYTADTSLAFNPAGGQIVGEYLADITEAAGRRNAAQIYDKGKAGEISVAEAVEALAEIQGKGAAQQIEPLLDARRINFAKKPPEPPLVFGLAGHKIATAGNLCVIAAQAKAGKTAAVSAMLARLFADPDGDGDFLGFEAAPPGGKAVVLFDTEQSPFDAWRVMSRTMSRAGRDNQPKNFRAYFLLDLSIQERRRALSAELKRAERICGGIHSIIIDGVADLCEDVNDPKEANGLVNELVSLAVRYFCPVVCILHENPAQPGFAGKTRGHLGSQLERKAESNLRVKKDSEGVSVIYSERGCRHAEIPEPTAPRFKYCDKAGMHISCEAAGVAKAESAREEMREEVSEIFNTHESIAGLTWSQVCKRIEEIHGIKRTGATKRLDKLAAAGIIKKNSAGLWTR